MTDHIEAQRLKLNERFTLEDHAKRRASLVLAGHATDAAELLRWLDMLGLPPCERALRTRGNPPHPARREQTWLTRS